MTTWRTTQLGTELCDQDQLILNLVGQFKVRIHGEHNGFAQHVSVDDSSDFCLIFFNNTIWLSDLKQQCVQYLRAPTSRIYMGINRYLVKGNDTLNDYTELIDQVDSPGKQLIQVVSTYLDDLGFDILKSGCFEKDQGRYFNFVQPLTWIYAERKTNLSNRTQ